MCDDYSIRNEIIETCRWLRREKYVFGTWGNVSVRLEDGNILITPSKIDYDEMTPEDLVILSPDGNVVSGFRLSTSERELHLGIMRKRPDVGAIIHSHSTYAMAAACRDKGIPAFSDEICQLIGGPIPLTSRYVTSSKHVELGEVATESATNANALLIRNHGPMCFGRTLKEAKVCVQILEKSCEIYLHLLMASGGVSRIPDEDISGGRDYFLNLYGKS